MKIQLIAKRYATGLVGAIESDQEFHAINQEITDFLNLIKKNKEFNHFIFSPFYPKNKKEEIVKEILKKNSFSEKSKRFILLLIEKDRLLYLEEILNLFHSIWNEKKNIHTFEVNSAYPLTEDQKKRLTEKLEKIIQGKVILKFNLDPALIGGLKIRKENILYDGSIKGNLLKLKEKILSEE